MRFANRDSKFFGADVELRVFLQFLSPTSPQMDKLRSEVMVSGILSNLQTFLDSMESHDCLPKVLDILLIIAERYQAIFDVAFKVGVVIGEARVLGPQCLTSFSGRG